MNPGQKQRGFSGLLAEAVLGALRGADRVLPAGRRHGAMMLLRRAEAVRARCTFTLPHAGLLQEASIAASAGGQASPINSRRSASRDVAVEKRAGGCLPRDTAQSRADLSGLRQVVQRRGGSTGPHGACGGARTCVPDRGTPARSGQRQAGKRRATAQPADRPSAHWPQYFINARQTGIPRASCRSRRETPRETADRGRCCEATRRRLLCPSGQSAVAPCEY